VNDNRKDDYGPDFYPVPCFKLHTISPVVMCLNLIVGLHACTILDDKQTPQSDYDTPLVKELPI